MSPPPKYLPLLTISTEDWERLLEPISEDSPSGESLIYEGTYDQIRETRRQEDPTLPQGDWQIKLKKADWMQVRTLCIDALMTRTKDLQLAAWLTEALLCLHGYTGLKAGLQLIIHFCENYWETMYPLLEENNEVEMRISPLVWMNEKLSLQLGNVAITSPTSKDALPYSFLDRESAWLLENRPHKEKQAAETAGRPTRTKFLISATLSPREFYVNLATDLQESIEYVDTLNQWLDNYCGKQAPSLGRFRDTLVSIQRVVETILKDKPAETESETESTIDEDPTAGGKIPAGKLSIKDAAPPIRSRGEAYRRLAEAADFLMQHEPHSPTPYLVKRAIKWGNMSLTELLMELVNDNKDLTAIYHLLGIKTEE